MSYLPKAFTEEGPRPGAGAAPSAASEDSGMREREREREREAYKRVAISASLTCLLANRISRLDSDSPAST